MANQGFLISDTLNISAHHLIYQSFLKVREQLSKAEVKESQATGSVRIYIKQTIQRASYKKVYSDQE